MTQAYRQEDVQQILNLAIARQTDAGELTRQQLTEIAIEMGISPSDLQAAEQEWFAKRGEIQEQQVFDQYRRCRFRRSLMKYLIVNAFLVTLNVVTTGGISWAIYVILGWGLGLALDAWKTFQPSPEDYEKSFTQWRRKRRLKKSVDTFLDRCIKGPLSQL